MGNTFIVCFNDGDTMKLHDIDVDSIKDGVVQVYKLEDNGIMIILSFPLTSIKYATYNRDATEQEKATIKAMRGQAEEKEG